MFDIPTLANAFQGSNDTLRECHGYFSQSGEDILIDILLAHEKVPGLFVDFGAYHPIRFSNSFSMYLRGWRGVNVDANTDAIAAFNAIRPLDVNVHALLSDKVEDLNYFKFAEGAWNTTNPAVVEGLAARNRPECSLVKSETYRTTTPNQILDQYVGDKKLDFINIDVEGLDIKLLQSINFDKYRPKVLIVELSIDDWSSEPVASFLKKIRYRPVSQCLHSAVFCPLE